MSKFVTKRVLFWYFWARILKRYCHIWNQHPWICLITKYWEIMKMSKFVTKRVLFWYFWARILKRYCHIWNQHLRISVIAKLCEETKMLKCGTKNALLGIFGQEFQKSILIFEISTLKFVYPENYTDKKDA